MELVAWPRSASASTVDLGSVGLCAGALGASDFPETFMPILSSLLDIDMLSAYVIQPDGAPRYLFARSLSSERNAFAQQASQRYAASFWKADPAIPRLFDAAAPGHATRVYQQCWNKIADSGYRQWAYERPGVEDRVSFTGRCAGRQVLLNVYRSFSKGAFTASEFARCLDLAQPLTALVAQHARLLEAQPCAALHPALDTIEARIQKFFPLLSRREREVCANLLTGMSDKEIARARVLELSSVVTYKRRAYSKLNVCDRRGLVQRYMLVASQGDAGPPQVSLHPPEGPAARPGWGRSR